MREAAAPSIKFIYNYCNDVEAMRQFYIELLGLPQTFFMNDERGRFLEFNCEGIEFMFFQASAPLPVPTEFSRQPGWEGGTLERPSCSIEYPPREFAACVKRLQTAGVRSAKPAPECHGSYWAFPVLDPMGNTVEPVLQLPEELPAGTGWGGSLEP
jgi:catechol 2,3-dioxygenase-like lactoylglutathione lyase family enzyme